MSEKTSKPTVSARKTGLLTKLGIGVSVLLALLVVAYLVATSVWFLKSVILPKAGVALNARITVEDAALSPFSSVTLTRLKVTPQGEETLFSAEEARLRYSLLDIIHGRINVAEISVSSPMVQVIFQADGTSNLDPILKAQKAVPAPPPKTAAPSQSLQLDLKKVVLNNATVRYVQKLKNGGQQVVELTGLTFTADDLANNRAGKIGLATDLKFDQGLAGPSNGVIGAKLAGTFDLALDAFLMPATVKGAAKLRTTLASGTLKDAAGLGASLETELTLKELKSAVLEFDQAGQSLGLVRVSGPFDSSKLEAKLRADIAGIDRRLLNMAGAMFGADFNSTTLNSTNQIDLAQGAKQITVKGALAVGQFSFTRTGQTTPVLDLNAVYELTANRAVRHGPAELKKLTVAFRPAGQPGGTLEVSGSYHVSESHGHFIAGLTNLDQNLLGPFLSPWLGDRQLVSMVINAGAEAWIGAGFAAVLKSDLSLTNLVLKDPAAALFPAPLELGASLDATYTNSVLQLRQLRMALPPTPRAANLMTLAGKLDLTASKTITGSLALTSPGLDFTRYYQMFASPPATNLPAATTNPMGRAPATNAPSREPEPLLLPLHQFDFSSDLAAVYLEEVVVSNWVQTTRLDGGQITVDPFKLSLNGAPVSAKAVLNLGVKGWEYDVSLNADRVPIAPFAHLRGYATHGEVQGFLVADAAIKGAGITPSSLQKNLIGTANFAITNASIEMKTGDAVTHAKGLLPSLLGGLGTVFKPVLGFLGAPDVLQSPLTLIAARIELGQGQINLKQAGVESSLFRAGTTGTITLGDPMDSSRYNDLPLDLALSRDTALRARLASSSTPTHQAFVQLPSFVTVGGTFAKQDVQIKKTAILGLIGKSVIGFVPQAGDAAGGALKGLIGLLTGDKPKAGTNAVPATNTPGGSGLFKAIGGLFGNKSSPPPPTTNAVSPAGATNAPGPNPPAEPPKKPGLLDFLK